MGGWGVIGVPNADRPGVRRAGQSSLGGKEAAYVYDADPKDRHSALTRSRLPSRFRRK